MPLRAGWGGWQWRRGSSGPGGEAEWGLAGALSGDSGRCSRLGPETPRLGKGPQTTSLIREGGVANTGPLTWVLREVEFITPNKPLWYTDYFNWLFLILRLSRSQPMRDI